MSVFDSDGDDSVLKSWNKNNIYSTLGLENLVKMYHS